MAELDGEFNKLMMSEMGLDLRCIPAKRTIIIEVNEPKMDVIKTALSMMGDNQQHLIVTYDIDIEQSDYDSKMSVIRLGTRAKGDYRDYAIIAEEVAHANQDAEGYWAMRLAKLGLFSSIFQYIVERDAKKRAKEILLKKRPLSIFMINLEVDLYYKETLKLYRKKVFGI